MAQEQTPQGPALTAFVPEPLKRVELLTPALRKPSAWTSFWPQSPGRARPYIDLSGFATHRIRSQNLSRFRGIAGADPVVIRWSPLAQWSPARPPCFAGTDSGA